MEHEIVKSVKKHLAEVSKDKLTLEEFIAQQEIEGDETIEDHIEWAKKFIIGLMEGHHIHFGDCVNIPCPCDLCVLERILTEYREYYVGKR